MGKTLEEAISEAIGAPETDQEAESNFPPEPPPEETPEKLEANAQEPEGEGGEDPAPEPEPFQPGDDLEGGEEPEESAEEGGEGEEGEEDDDPSLDLIDPATGKTKRELLAEKKAAEQEGGEQSLEGLSDEELSELPEDVKKHVKEETSKRFNELTRRLAERSQVIDRLSKENQALNEVYASFNTTPENVSRLSRFSSALSAGTPEAMEYAWNELVTIGRQLAERLGRPFPLGEGYDPLSAFPDLKQAVDEFKMEREEAEKQAADRAKAQMWKEASHRAQSQQAYESAINRTRQAVGMIEQAIQNAVGERYMEPVFAGPEGPTSMQQLLTGYVAQLGGAVRAGQLAPDNVPQMVDEFARNLIGQLQRTQPAQNAPSPQNQQGQPGGDEPAPIRPSGEGRRGKQAPKSDYDAITQGLGM